jgi:hypothetical protein
MREHCQFCKRRVARRRPDGGLEQPVVAIDYYGFSYHVACYEKLKGVAARTGGLL